MEHRVGVRDVLLGSSHEILDGFLPAPEFGFGILQLVPLVPELLLLVPALRLPVRGARTARILELRHPPALLALLTFKLSLHRGALLLPRLFNTVELLAKLQSLSLVREPPVRRLPLQPRRLPVQGLEPGDGALVLAFLRVDAYRPLAGLALKVSLRLLAQSFGVV